MSLLVHHLAHYILSRILTEWPLRIEFPLPFCVPKRFLFTHYLSFCHGRFCSIYDLFQHEFNSIHYWFDSIHFSCDSIQHKRDNLVYMIHLVIYCDIHHFFIFPLVSVHFWRVFYETRQMTVSLSASSIIGYICASIFITISATLNNGLDFSISICLSIFYLFIFFFFNMNRTTKIALAIYPEAAG